MKSSFAACDTPFRQSLKHTRRDKYVSKKDDGDLEQRRRIALGSVSYVMSAATAQVQSVSFMGGVMRRTRRLSLVFLIALAASNRPVSAQVTQEWVTRYDGPIGYGAGPSAIAVDANGNVHVTGQACAEFDSEDGCFAVDYATVKYDAAGNQLWVARYSGRSSLDRATAIALDAAGDVYVTGYSSRDGTFNDYATVKYTQN
jgi:hypothetical protein